MARRTLLVGVLAVVVAGTAASSAFATHSWGSYHWARTANPLPLTVIDTTSSTWTSYVTTAISQWGSSTVLRLTRTTGTANRRCAPVSGKVQVCNNTYGNNGWLGLASIWTVSGTTHIAQATTKLNDTYFNTSTYGNTNERAHVVCQEIGHDWGLDHQDTSGADFNTCMDYFSNTGANAGITDSTQPALGDYDQLLAKYDPSTTTALSSSWTNSSSQTITHNTGTPTGHLDSSNSWTSGAVVQAPGRDGVFVSHEGNLTRIDYVFWANPIH